jgi:prevent-host-death family protein
MVSKKNVVSVSEARTHLSHLLRRVARGQEFIVTKRGVPVAWLVPVSTKKPKRILGAYGDTITVADDFDAPLPDEFLDLFEGRRTAKKRG